MNKVEQIIEIFQKSNKKSYKPFVCYDFYEYITNSQGIHDIKRHWVSSNYQQYKNKCFYSTFRMNDNIYKTAFIENSSCNIYHLLKKVFYFYDENSNKESNDYIKKTLKNSISINSETLHNDIFIDGNKYNLKIKPVLIIFDGYNNYDDPLLYPFINKENISVVSLVKNKSHTIVFKIEITYICPKEFDNYNIYINSNNDEIINNNFTDKIIDYIISNNDYDELSLTELNNIDFNIKDDKKEIIKKNEKTTEEIIEKTREEIIEKTTEEIIEKTTEESDGSTEDSDESMEDSDESMENSDKSMEDSDESMEDSDEETIIYNYKIKDKSKIINIVFSSYINNNLKIYKMLKKLYKTNIKFPLLLENYTNIKITKDIHLDYSQKINSYHFTGFFYNEFKQSNILHFYIKYNKIISITEINNLL